MLSFLLDPCFVTFIVNLTMVVAPLDCFYKIGWNFYCNIHSTLGESFLNLGCRDKSIYTISISSLTLNSISIPP